MSDLQAIELETQSLLRDVKKASSKKTSQSPMRFGTVKKAKDDDGAGGTKRKAKKKELSQSFDSGTMEKTRNLYDVGTSRFSRLAAEVDDEVSMEATHQDSGRSTTKLTASVTFANSQHIQLMEEKYGKLKFHSEVSRAQLRDDTFVPAPGITAAEVEKERDRLYKLGEVARSRREKQYKEVTEQREFFAADKSAVKLQALYRGHVGRKIAGLTKRIAEMNQGATGQWIEVRDRESGDVWYYNTITGVSQWEKPEEMTGKVLDKVKKLPTLVDKKKTKATKQQPKQLEHSTTLPNLDKTKTVKYEDLNATAEPPVSKAIIDKELEEQFNVTNMSSKDSLVAPDGSFKPQLRSTVQAALLESRFDSISSVLADQRWMDIEETRPKRAKFAPKDPFRKPMVAMVNLQKPPKEYPNRMSDSRPGSMEDTRTLPQDSSDLTLCNVSHPGFDVNGQPENMCFGCWSSGSKKKCSLHEDGLGPRDASQTMLLCRNWDLDVMRRRYRSEEIQEVFMKKAQSLRYDNLRKKFISVVEQRHPVYRACAFLLDKFNTRARLMAKTVRWMKSFVDEIRMGSVRPGRTAEQARLIRVRRSLVQWTQVSAYTNEVHQLLPLAPITGTSWAERCGVEQYLFDHPDPALGLEVQLIIASPTPIPNALYQPRVYHLPAPKSIPMPKPDYEEDFNAAAILPSNQYIDELSPASWLEHMSASIMRSVVQNAQLQITSVTPIPGLELLRRTKYPVPCTIQFATLGRKPTPGMLSVGGLSVEFLVSQLVTTYIPPQYGNFMVMDKATVSPGISPEVTITFQSYPMTPVMQMYVPRPVEHPLNYRRAPTICINTKAALEEKYLYGLNRPEQTGERESHGFRTTAWARHLLINEVTDPRAFTPGAEVVSLNIPAANIPFTTHADYTYPFCEPSTRDNTTLDFFHLLLTAVNSSSKAQIFTSITQQDPGEFQKMSDITKPMGNVLVNVYRSWAFMQKDPIVEFKSDDGVPYWYHRRTGQTFWERPLGDEEEKSPLLGGTRVDDAHAEEPFTMHKGIEGQERRYNQGEFRKLMLNHHETVEEATRRRRDAQATARTARQKGKLPDVIEGVSKIANASSAEDVSPAMSPMGKMEKHDSYSETEMKRGARPPSPAPSADSRYSSESSLLTTKQPAFKPGGAMEAHRESTFSYEREPQMPGRLDPNFIAAMTNTLTNMMSSMQLQNTTPQDMIQLGMGMGIAMMQSGAMPMASPSRLDQGDSMTLSIMDEDFSHRLPPSPRHYSVNPDSKEPIGVATPTVPVGIKNNLDHKEETKKHEHHAKLAKEPTTALEKAKELKVYAAATETPDEVMQDEPSENLLSLNADDEVRDNVPVLVYPELSSITHGGPPAEFSMHPPSGIGSSFVLKKDADSQKMVEGSKVLRRAVAVLPVGFFESIHAKKVAKQIVDYLPQVPNLPASRSVGRVKPRSAAVDWVTIGFDPWSAGKSPLSTEFIPSLASKAEQIFDAAKLAEMKKGTEDGIISVHDNEGITAQKVEMSKAQKMAEDFRKVCSLCRHSKFAEVEDLMNHPDWNIPMDYQDDAGNTLLHIAAQNGNKRMVKLCMRRGSDLNAQNLNGQTPLHFAFAYGYSEVGNYMISKGGDDSIRNKDGLTCYEGLSQDDLIQL